MYILDPDTPTPQVSLRQWKVGEEHTWGNRTRGVGKVQPFPTRSNLYLFPFLLPHPSHVAISEMSRFPLVGSPCSFWDAWDATSLSALRQPLIRESYFVRDGGPEYVRTCLQVERQLQKQERWSVLTYFGLVRHFTVFFLSAHQSLVWLCSLMRQAVYALFMILIQTELYRRLARPACSINLQSPSSYSYLPGKILLPLSFTLCHMPAPPFCYSQVTRTEQSSYEQYANPNVAMLVECLTTH